MPSCVACGAELELLVRVPHTVYVKSLYRIGGQDYCRHHIIRAAVAASDFSVAFYLRQTLSLGNELREAMRFGKNSCRRTPASSSMVAT